MLTVGSSLDISAGPNARYQYVRSRSSTNVPFDTSHQHVGLRAQQLLRLNSTGEQVDLLEDDSTPFQQKSKGRLSRILQNCCSDSMANRYTAKPSTHTTYAAGTPFYNLDQNRCTVMNSWQNSVNMPLPLNTEFSSYTSWHSPMDGQHFANPISHQAPFYTMPPVQQSFRPWPDFNNACFTGCYSSFMPRGSVSSKPRHCPQGSKFSSVRRKSTRQSKQRQNSGLVSTTVKPGCGVTNNIEMSVDSLTPKLENINLSSDISSEPSGQVELGSHFVQDMEINIEENPTTDNTKMNTVCKELSDHMKTPTKMPGKHYHNCVKSLHNKTKHKAATHDSVLSEMDLVEALFDTCESHIQIDPTNASASDSTYAKNSIMHSVAPVHSQNTKVCNTTIPFLLPSKKRKKKPTSSKKRKQLRERKEGVEHRSKLSMYEKNNSQPSQSGSPVFGDDVAFQFGCYRTPPELEPCMSGVYQVASGTTDPRKATSFAFVVTVSDSDSSGSDWDDDDDGVSVTDSGFTDLHDDPLLNPFLFRFECIMSPCTDSQSSNHVEDRETENLKHSQTPLQKQISRFNHLWCITGDGNQTLQHEDKKVHFATGENLVNVHPAEDWARRGPWEEYARDRVRFKDRIEKVNDSIGYIFDAEHREKIYNKYVSCSVPTLP